MAKEKEDDALYYKDVRVAPSSQLGQALAANNFELAAKLYKEANDEFWKHNKGWKPYPPATTEVEREIKNVLGTTEESFQ